MRVAALGENGLSDAAVVTIEGTTGVVMSAPSFERRTYLGAAPFGPGPLPAPVSAVGIDPEREPRIHDLTLTFGQGLGSAGDPNALVSATLAREDGLSIGSRLGIEGIDEPVYLRIGGILAGDGPGAAPTAGP